MTEPIFCDLQAVTDEQRERLFALTPEILGQAIAVTSDEFGYELEFDNHDPAFVATLGEFLELDARCCKFIDHNIVLPSSYGNVRITLRGPSGTGDALKHDMDRFLPADVLAAASPPVPAT